MKYNLDEVEHSLTQKEMKVVLLESRRLTTGDIDQKRTG